MIQNFTPNDVLLANSNELSDELQSLLTICLHENKELDEFSSALRQIEQEMEKMIPSTDERQVQLIMQRVQAIKKMD
jgi:hypothetical protein